MTSSPALEAAKHFLSVVWDGDPPADEALLAALDALVAAYHFTPDGDVSDADVDAPGQEAASLYAEVASRFPDYGLYPVADPTKPLDEALMMADAIDDLADITLDMRDVVWNAEHLGIDDAHFSFRLLFFHWGQHARELSLFLCGRMWG
jgi:hypothetical protein